MKKIKLLSAIIAISTLNTSAQYAKIHDFAAKIATATGARPISDLISDGTFLYGTTGAGGANGFGTVFKIKPDGTEYTILINFNDNNGNNPVGSLYYDGTYLYGMTYLGGKYRDGTGQGVGVLYKLKPDGTAFQILLEFNGYNGYNPYGALISDGTHLYGMTEYGGINGVGNIFKINKDGTGYIDMYDFDGISNGGYPQGSLYYDGSFLYGMTQYFNNNPDGNIFKINPDGTGFMDIKDFGGSDGSTPLGSLISDGTSLYGMTSKGGAYSAGNVFKINKDGTGYTSLSDFDVAGATGSTPQASLVFDNTNTYLYGMTSGGGASYNGNVFKVKPDGTGFVDLIDFDGTTGQAPYGSLCFQGTSLYGMTSKGGINNAGNIFKMMPDGTGFTDIFDFNIPVGTISSTYGDLLYDGSFLYGMTSTSNSSYGCVFKVKPDGTAYDTVMNFDATTGNSPYGGLITDGTFLYGMTSAGGTGGKGTVFKIESNGAGYDTVMNFNGTNGSTPHGSLVFDNTFLYGMTSAGGAYGKGNIFKVEPDGTNYTTLFDFDSIHGSNPLGSLIFDNTSTSLYGLTQNGYANNYGNIFKIQTNGTGYTNLISFDSTHGSHPLGSLVYDGTFLYGMASKGGAYNDGSIFKIKPDGTGFDSVISFNGINGNYPKGGALVIKNNVLYGMTSQGGSYSYGNIFKVNVDGTGFTDLLDFNGTNGGTPYASLITDGTRLYGTTSVSGNNTTGTVFKLCIPIAVSQSPIVCGHYTIGSHTYTISGTYIDTIASSQVCDSVVTTNLTILPVSTTAQTFTVCPGQVVTVGTHTYTATGTYNDTLTAHNMCDSIVTTHVITSSCVTGIAQNAVETNVNIYPNPTNGVLNLQLSKSENVQIKICDVIGNIIYQNNTATSFIQIDLSTQPDGIYFISIKTNESNINKKVVIRH